MDAVLTPRYVSTDLQRSQSDPRYERKRKKGYIRGPRFGGCLQIVKAQTGENGTRRKAMKRRGLTDPS